MPLEGIQNILPRIQARGFCGTGQTALRRRSDAHQGKFLGLIKVGSGLVLRRQGGKFKRPFSEPPGTIF